MHKFLLMNSIHLSTLNKMTLDWLWNVTKSVTKLKEHPLRQLYFITISFVWYVKRT